MIGQVEWKMPLIHLDRSERRPHLIARSTARPEKYIGGRELEPVATIWGAREHTLESREAQLLTDYGVTPNIRTT